MSLRAVVKGIEKSGQWKKAAEVVGISAIGSSLTLGRQCEAGTLVTIVLQAPAHLRFYDHDKEFYEVWGLVQHCEPMTSEDASKFHIGVAFIGKNCPDSYVADPLQHYRISGVGHDGMWSVTELQRAFRKRADLRFWRNVVLYLAVIDSKEGPARGERTTAQNVSRHGATVLTTMKLGIGDRVKFISEKYDFSGLAVVRNVEVGDDGRTRLHLKFVESTFPVEMLMTPETMVSRM